MHLTGLTRLVASLPEIRRACASAPDARVFGLLGAARPVFAAALLEQIESPALIVTAHPHEAADLVRELPAWTDWPVTLFPALEALPYEHVRLDREAVAARERVARDLAAGAPRIVVAPARALLQPIEASVRQDAWSARVGSAINLEETLDDWMEKGYVPVRLVEDPGTFARRGGVLDVFPTGAEKPIRIELFGHEIESVRIFDPASQRSVGVAAEIVVQPIAAFDADSRVHALEQLIDVDTSNLNAEALGAWQNGLTRLEAGASLDDISMFGPYLISRPSSIVDHFPPSAHVVIDDARQTGEVLRSLAEQGEEVQKELVESGNLPEGLRSALLDVESVEASIASRSRTRLFGGSPENRDNVDVSELFAPARHYASRLRSLVRDIAESDSRATVIVTLQRERVAELLEEEAIAAGSVNSVGAEPPSGVSILAGSLQEGWVLPAGKFALLTDYELFGRARTRPVIRRPRRAREAFFTQYAPGDYVVHLEHGIGRFSGVTRMEIDGAEREYAIVQYAGSDRVYVPTDQLERLTRYVGMGDAAPALSKLGGGEWQRARQRAKQAADDIAKELIDVYAKRMARPAHAFPPDTPWQHELESSFPYPETPDQLRAAEEVKEDMEASRPMDRLVCADVGYGKTEVAVRAAFKAVMDGKQVAVLVPTTILAQQHLETFSERFAGFPVRVEALSRFRTREQQKEILKGLTAGTVDIVIGTHRLLQKDVSFKNLGLLVVDEEQRFGVRHKEQLKKLRESIDVLTLTATPIPRTLHMGLAGIREISVIETPPEGRLPIKTYLQPFEDRLVREAILRELDRDGQVYLVHNKVATIDAMAERIRTLVPEARLVVGHGQMDEALLEKVMLSFARHEADVLVCSTIIENGVDIPNVNTIVVNGTHRLGLTQLYQLRGRVGRSENQAYAYLLYPRDVQLSQDAIKRMEAVFEARELGAGLSIAMKDLEIRGVGNLLGAEQSGHAQAIGFDLYTRMIGDAVERLRGVPVKESSPVTLDLPLTMFLPAEYVGDESERLTLYRRLAAVESGAELDQISAEIADRFGAPPPAVQNLILSVRLKMAAKSAGVTSLTLNAEQLIVRSEPTALYDRVSLYHRYGMEARISTNVLRIPRAQLGPDWVAAIRQILEDMVALRESITNRRAVEAG